MLKALYRQYLIDQARKLWDSIPWYEKDDEPQNFESATNDQLKEFIINLMKEGY